MKSSHCKIFIVVVLVPVLFLAFVLFNPPTPRLPPMLQDITANSRSGDVCSATTHAKYPEITNDLANQSTLDERLINEFPIGSDGTHLSQVLIGRGFEMRPPCRTDSSIQNAIFKQNGGGLLFYPMFAKISWKVDSDNKIIWIKGFVSFLGL